MRAAGKRSGRREDVLQQHKRVSRGKQQQKHTQEMSILRHDTINPLTVEFADRHVDNGALVFLACAIPQAWVTGIPRLLQKQGHIEGNPFKHAIIRHTADKRIDVILPFKSQNDLAHDAVKESLMDWRTQWNIKDDCMFWFVYKEKWLQETK